MFSLNIQLTQYQCKQFMINQINVNYFLNSSCLNVTHYSFQGNDASSPLKGVPTICVKAKFNVTAGALEQGNICLKSQYNEFILTFTIAIIINFYFVFICTLINDLITLFVHAFCFQLHQILQIEAHQ